MAELTEAGRIFGGCPEVSFARGMLSNLSNIMKIALGSSPTVMQSLWSLCQAQGLPITSGGALITSIWALHEIGKGGVTEQKPVEDRLHFILLDQGFPISIFNIWTFALDENRGIKTAADASVNDDLKRRGLEPAYGPGYTAKITTPKAAIIRLLPFVRVVYLHPTFEQKRIWSTVRGAFERNSQNQSLSRGFAASRKRELEEGQAQMNLAAFAHRKGSLSDWDYTRDSSGGNDVTIFVPDSGAAIDGPAWQELQAPRDMFDWADHGTDMACLAGGYTFSLAPKSNLYLIKTANAWLVEPAVLLAGEDVWMADRPTPDSLHDAYIHIVQIVEDRGLQGRAVISSSKGFHFDRYINDESTWEPFARGEGPEMTEEEVKGVIDELADFVQAVNEVYDDIAKAARLNGIIWIPAVGNQGAYPPGLEDPRIVPGAMAAAGDTIPRFGSTRESETITVSAALEDGTPGRERVQGASVWETSSYMMTTTRDYRQAQALDGSTFTYLDTTCLLVRLKMG